MSPHPLRTCRSARVSVPVETAVYRASCKRTGETLESGDLASLLRHVALSLDEGKWKIWKVNDAS